MPNFFETTVIEIGMGKARRVATTEATLGYKAPLHTNWRQSRIEELPPFRLHTAIAMMTDPVVKIGMKIRNALIAVADVEIKAQNAQVEMWVRRQWDRIWKKNWPKISQAKQWGYEGLEIVWERDRVTGLINVEKVKDFAPIDTRPLTFGGNIVGISVKNRGISVEGVKTAKFFSPRSLWVNFDSRWGSPFGQSILLGSYSPWYEKWMDNGAKKTTQTRMLKDAYPGLLGFFDPTIEKTPEGDEFSGRDMMREIAENVLSAGAVCLPSKFDPNGNKMYDFTRMPDAGDPSGIFEWGKQLDKEIWFGIGITPEIIEAAATGSGFSGRSIPLIVTLQMVAEEFAEYMQAIDQQVLRPAAQLNFGLGVDYELTPVDIVETFTEKIGGSQMAGGALGGGVVNGQMVDGRQPPQISGPSQQGDSQTQQPPSEPGSPEQSRTRAVSELSESALRSIIANDRDPRRRAEAEAALAQRTTSFAEFDESKHPRGEEGTSKGGQFVGKGGGGGPATAPSSRDTVPAAHRLPDGFHLREHTLKDRTSDVKELVSDKDIGDDTALVRVQTDSELERQLELSLIGKKRERRNQLTEAAFAKRDSLKTEALNAGMVIFDSDEQARLAIGKELTRQLGSPQTSSLSPSQYWFTENGRSIRLSNHLPVYFFEDSGVNVVPFTLARGGSDVRIDSGVAIDVPEMVKRLVAKNRELPPVSAKEAIQRINGGE